MQSCRHRSAVGHNMGERSDWRYLERAAWCVQAMVEGQKGTVVWSNLVALTQQHLDVGVGADLW